MKNRVAALLLIAGIGLVILGFVLRSTEVHTVGTTGSLVCGSATSPNLEQATHDGLVQTFQLTQAGVTPTQDFANLNVAACEDSLSTRSTWSWVLIAAGAVALLGAFFTYQGPAKRTSTDETTTPADAST